MSPIISPSPNGGASPALAATTRLTNAQILGMSVTPVVAVAGVAGFVIMPIQMCLVVQQGGAVYTAPSNYKIEAIIGDGSGWAGSCIAADNVFAGGSPGEHTAMLGQFTGTQGAFNNDKEPVGLLDGLPLSYRTTLAGGGGDGTGSAIIYTVYALVPTT